MKIQLTLIPKLIYYLLVCMCLTNVRAQTSVEQRQNAGPSRQAGGGQTIQAYLLADLPNLAAPYPANFMLVDAGREGLFRLDNTDTSTPDNRGTVLVVGGKRYKRAYKGMIEVEWFGAKGSGNDKDVVAATTNTTAIQAACDWAALSSGTATDQVLTPANKDRPAVVHIPSGTYYTTATIDLHGAINIKGDGGMSFGGTVIVTQKPGYHLFSLRGAALTQDGGMNAVEIHDMRVLMTHSPIESAVIYSGNPINALFHSLRVEGVWFQLAGPAQRVYIGKQADDVKFTNCTFDGTRAVAFVLGTTKPTDKITNFAITNCTGYLNFGGLIYANNVDGLLFANNRIFGRPVVPDSPGSQTPFIIDALTHALQVNGLQIIGNRFDRVNRVLITKFDQALVVGNHIIRANSRVFEFGGSGIVKDCRFNDNIISGTWSTTTNAGGKVIPDAPISSYGATIANSEFRNTIIDASGSSSTAYYLPLTGTPCNIIDSKVTGFSNPFNVQNFDCAVYTGNAASKSSRSAGNLANLTDKAKARTSLGLNTAATQPKEAFIAASDGKLTQAYSASLTTAGWSTNNYTEVIAPATLTDATIYLVKAVYRKTGLDIVVQSWVVPITTTYPNSANAADLTSNTSIYSGNAERHIRLRQKRGSAANTTFGLEAALAKSDMASGDATVVITVTPLF